MNPLALGLGTTGAMSVLGRMLSPLDAPRRALWNFLDYGSGGMREPGAAPPFFSMGNDDGYLAGGGVRDPGVSGMEGGGPLRFAPELGQGRPIPQPSGGPSGKDWTAMLPLLAGLGVGVATGGAGFGLAPAIMGALGTAGVGQLLGEASDAGNFNPASTHDLYGRIGIDSHPLVDTATEMLLDPNNLMGVAAWSKAKQAEKAAELAKFGQVEGRLAQQAEMAASPSLRPAGAMSGFPERQSIGFASKVEPESELLRALDQAGDVGKPDRLAEIRSRLLEMMGEQTPGLPTSTSTLAEMASPRSTMVIERPILPIPRKPTSMIPPPSKRYG